MSEKPDQISLICRSKEMQEYYSFLSSAYKLRSFASVDSALLSEDFHDSQVVLLDINDPVQYARIIGAINKKNPEAKIIMAWGVESMLLPAEIPRIFYFIRKPFSKDRLSEIIEKAFSFQISKEKRKEPRIEIEIPVDLLYKTRLWKTKTRNISLHGMQVIWPQEELVKDILQEHSQGRKPIHACRLYLSEIDIINEDHINISILLRYVANTVQVEDPVLMGFEFDKMDLELRTRLYRAVTEYFEAQ